MIPPVSKNPLLVKIASGDVAGDLLQFLVDRQLPFTDEEYLEGWALAGNHPKFGDPARERLLTLPESVALNYIARRETHPVVCQWVLEMALAREQVEILTAAWNNPALEVASYTTIAERGPAALLDILIENQIRLIGFPEILAALERNPGVSPFVRGKIEELRRFYLAQAPAEAIPVSRVAEVEELLLTEIASQPGTADPSSVPEELHKKAQSSLEKINSMSVSERIKLALSGTKTERMILLKDANRMVATAVLESPKMSDDEVLLIVRDKSMSGELVAKIAENRYWTRNYTVVLELLQNPKTPTGRAMAFVKLLHMRDLRQVMTDRNVPPVIRTVATNLFREKNRVSG